MAVRRHSNQYISTNFLKMPLFPNRLSYKKSSRRKIIKPEIKNEDCDSNDNTITLRLGDIETTFYNGQWIPQTGPISETNKENETLKQIINQLEEENNLWKLKYEILLDMLAQSAAQS